MDWKTTADGIRKTGEQVLGRTLGKRKEGKENWWWKDNIQEALRIKRHLSGDGVFKGMSRAEWHTKMQNEMLRRWW